MLFAADFRKKAREALRGQWKKYGILMGIAMAVTDAFGFGFGIVLSGLLILQPAVEFCWGSCSLFRVGSDSLSLIASALVLLCLLFSQLVSVGRYRLSAAILDGRRGSLRDLFPLRLLGKSIIVGLITSAAASLPMVISVIAAVNGASLSESLVSLISIAGGVLSIVLILNFAMAAYLLAKNPEMGAFQALGESRRRMAGNRGKYISLAFSFLGWILLAELPSLISLSNLGTQHPLLASVLHVPLGWIAMGLLNLYQSVSVTAFFRNVENPVQAEPQRPPFQWDADAQPHDEDARQPEPEAQPAPTFVDREPIAHDLFRRHGHSRRAMREAGVLEEYEKCCVDSSVEYRWIQEHGRALMARFHHDPAALDDILRLVEEYALDDLLDRAIERIERHLRQETLPARELVNMAGRVLALLSSGVFADREGYADRKRSQFRDFTGRLAFCLEQQEADGGWQQDIALLRQLCGSSQE